MKELIHRVLQKPVSLVRDFLNHDKRFGNSILFTADKNVLTITVAGVSYTHAFPEDEKFYRVALTNGQVYVNDRLINGPEYNVDKKVTVDCVTEVGFFNRKSKPRYKRKTT